MIKTSDAKDANEPYIPSGYRRKKLSTRCEDYVVFVKPLFESQLACVKLYGYCYSFTGQCKTYRSVNEYLDEVRFCLIACQTKGHLSNSMTVDEMMKELLPND